jgi:hypothetical protein
MVHLDNGLCPGESGHGDEVWQGSEHECECGAFARGLSLWSLAGLVKASRACLYETNREIL